MLARTLTVALIGTDARFVEVEVDVGTGGLPTFTFVGLPARSVREAEQRTRSAIEAVDRRWPRRRVVVNLAPGTLRKEGSHFDLPLAAGILAADSAFEPERLRSWVLMGELGLDGSVRPVRGVLAAAVACRETGGRGLICPAGNAREASLVEGVAVVPVADLAQTIAYLRGEWEPVPLEPPAGAGSCPAPDLREVRGHSGAKRALEIAAAGGHNLLLIGPPGSGKTMLARRLPGILPPMSLDESLDVTRIYSVAGMLGEDAGLVRDRPFRIPHHHVSLAGLIGGGSGLARPGEVSMAHRGVLFLDELTLYRRDVLETLRAPLEEGVVRIARSGGVIAYPCRFSLVGAMNPCGCGYLGDSKKPCRCTQHQLDLYNAKLSGPLLDRFDMQMTMARVARRDLMGEATGAGSAEVRARVQRARVIQTARYGSDTTTNASATKAQLEASARLSHGARAVLGAAIDGMSLSGRGVDRVVRVARTLADLAGDDEVDEDHLGSALGLRGGQIGAVAGA